MRLQDPIWKNCVAPFFGLWAWQPGIRNVYDGQYMGCRLCVLLILTFLTSLHNVCVEGVFSLWFSGKWLHLIPEYSSYAKLRKPEVRMLTADDFGGAIVSPETAPTLFIVSSTCISSCSYRILSAHMTILRVPGHLPNTTCDDVCRARGMC